MPRTITIRQFYGGLVGAAFWISGAIWYLYLWPRSLRRRIDSGEIDAFDGFAKLRKAPLFGYMLLLIALADLIGTLNYIRLFPDWIYLPLLPVVIIPMFFMVRALLRENRDNKTMNRSNQSMKPTPLGETSSACLPRHPAVAYLCLVRPHRT
jgi:hypothetical protein